VNIRSFIVVHHVLASGAILEARMCEDNCVCVMTKYSSMDAYTYVCVRRGAKVTGSKYRKSLTPGKMFPLMGTICLQVHFVLTALLAFKVRG
jgi:hypothetical protein